MIAVLKISILTLMVSLFITTSVKCETYKIIPKKVTGLEAQKVCIRLGGHLADIEDEATEIAVRNYVDTTPDLPDDERLLSFWIGRNDLALDSLFVTADGKVSSNYGWCKTAPTTDSSWNWKCAEYRNMNGYYCIYDDDCRYKKYFLCSFKD